jgi:hypothetical protein
MNQRAAASGMGACNHCRAAAMPIAAPKWRLWTKLYWMRLCSMRRQQAGRLKFAIRSRKGGTWRGFAPEQVLPSRTARHASRIIFQDDCWVCPHLNSMAMRVYSGGFRAHPRIYDVQSYVSETAPRLNMHRRTLQRILVKRAPIVWSGEERSARRVDATRLTVWWAKYGRP